MLISGTNAKRSGKLSSILIFSTVKSFISSKLSFNDSSSVTMILFKLLCEVMSSVRSLFSSCIMSLFSLMYNEASLKVASSSFKVLNIFFCLLFK